MQEFEAKEHQDETRDRGKNDSQGLMLNHEGKSMSFLVGPRCRSAKWFWYGSSCGMQAVQYILQQTYQSSPTLSIRHLSTIFDAG